MRRIKLLDIFATLLIFMTLGSIAIHAQTTEFSYQGFITENNAPANGNYDLEFRLFDAATGGTLIGTLQRSNVAVSNGIFGVVLNFGSFPLADRFLEIAVRPPGGSVSTTLAPRSKILSTPYSTNSINAQNAVNAVNAQNAANSTNAINATTANNSLQLGGVNASQFVQTNDARLSDSRNPLPNSTNYIQNRTTQQTSTNFNISGNGTAGGTLTGNIVNATTQFNLNNNRILSIGGTENIFAGAGAGAANTGINNSFFGANAGLANTSGNSNSFFGNNAGRFNTTVANSFFGFGAGNFTTVGDNNAFFGVSAGKNNTSGRINVFIGSRAGELNSTGSNNVFLGFVAGDSNDSGSDNTAVGFFADFGADNLTNATAIGARAMVEQSNALVLGSINGLNGATATTDVGIGVTQPARRLDVGGNIRIGSTTGTIGCIEDRDGTVIAGTCSSDLRFKKNITPFGNVLNNFSKLRPVNYYWRADEFADQRFGSKQSFGLIAQEVEDAFPELVATDEKGYKVVNYSKLPLYTIQAVNELKMENDALKTQVADQQKQISALTSRIEEQRKNDAARQAEIAALAQALKRITDPASKSIIKRSKEQ
jgi:FtsZ-binding cell division protein ZapB